MKMTSLTQVTEIVKWYTTDTQRESTGVTCAVITWEVNAPTVINLYKRQFCSYKFGRIFGSSFAVCSSVWLTRSGEWIYYLKYVNKLEIIMLIFGTLDGKEKNIVGMDARYFPSSCHFFFPYFSFPLLLRTPLVHVSTSPLLFYFLKYTCNLFQGESFCFRLCDNKQ